MTILEDKLEEMVIWIQIGGNNYFERQVKRDITIIKEAVTLSSSASLKSLLDTPAKASSLSNIVLILLKSALSPSSLGFFLPSENEVSLTC